MISAIICLVSAFVPGPLPEIEQAIPPAQLVGKTVDQVEAILGEANASMTAGGTGNLAVIRFYPGARLVVTYGGQNGAAVAVLRTK